MRSAASIKKKRTKNVRHSGLPLLLLMAATLAAACDARQTPQATISVDAALDLITVERLAAHVDYLASDALAGRKPGKQGYDLAANYVAEQFESMGVAAGGSEGWNQPVALRRFKLEGAGATLIIHRDGADRALKYRDDFSMNADPSREASEVRAPVVYVGRGVHAPEFGYSDYDGVDVRGKIVAHFEGIPSVIEGDAGFYYRSTSNKVKEAVARGAVGIIYLTSQKEEERDPWEEAKARFGKNPSTRWVNASGQAAHSYTEIVASAWLNVPNSEALFAASPLSYEEAHAAMLADTPSSMALGVELSLAQRSEHSTITSPNVIGLVRGSDPELSREYVVYTAHLDHIGVSDDEEKENRTYNGMYDNAMGVALMLETARAIAANPPRRSVLFIALTAEESGLLGSDFFVNNPTVPQESIVANINLDMPLFLFPLADLVAFGSQHSSLQQVVEAAANDEGFVFSPDPMPEENLFVRSDQYSFVRNGIPGIFLVSGFNSSDADIESEALYRDHLKSHYHQTSDDLTRPVHWPSALRFARAHTRMGFIISNADERPTWNEDSFYGRLFAARPQVRGDK